MAALRAEAFSAGFSEDEIWKIELSVEEVLVNIIKHGQTEEGIELSFAKSAPDGLMITIKDRGMPFDPSVSNFTTENSMTGGNGIALLRKYMDSIHYQRHNDCNLLTLTKLL